MPGGGPCGAAWHVLKLFHNAQTSAGVYFPWALNEGHARLPELHFF